MKTLETLKKENKNAVVIKLDVNKIDVSKRSDVKKLKNNVYLVEILKQYNIEYKFRESRQDYVIKTKTLNTIEFKPLSDSIKVACKYAILDDMRYYENYQLKYEKNTDLTDIENFIKSLIK